jgi:hypothetical protein
MRELDFFDMAPSPERHAANVPTVYSTPSDPRCHAGSGENGIHSGLVHRVAGLGSAGQDVGVEEDSHSPRPA